MAITYGAQTGTIVTSYAMNEILGDQAQQSGNRQVVVSDDIVTAGNGQIGTKYPSYVGRKVIINIDWTLRKDLSNETPAQAGVQALAYDSANGKIVAGTYPDGQIWVSDDGGDTWVLKKDLGNETPAQTGVLSLTYDSTNDKIIAGTYPDGQLWVSSDGGATWTLKKDLGNETPAQTYVYSLTYDSANDKIVAGTYPDAQIWVSADGGDTWVLKKDLGNETPAQTYVYSLTYDSANGKIIAGTNPDGQIWVSDDGGDTWVLKKDLSNETPAQNSVLSLTYDSANDKIIAGTYPDGQLWVSSDGGATWTLKKDLGNETPAQTYVYSLTYDSANGKIIAGTNPDAQIWASGDGGDTWVLKKDLSNETPAQNRVQALTYDSANGKIVAGTYLDAQIWARDDGEDRIVVSQAAGTGNTIILTVNEDWDGSNPVLADTIHVMYNIDDLETGGAGGGIGLSSKTGLYELSNLLDVGNGTDPAGLLLHEGTGLELDDRGNLNNMITRNNARFDVGYMQAGKPVSGGIMTGYNSDAGEPFGRFELGSLGRIVDCLMWAQLVPQTMRHVSGAGVVFRSVKFLSVTQACQLYGAKLYDVTFEGRGTTVELIRLDADTVIDGMVIISTAGLASTFGDTTTKTLSVKNVVFVNNLTLVTVESNKTWNIINPVWTVDETSQNDIEFLTGTANMVYERYAVDVVVQKADGTKLQDAWIIVYENTQLADLVVETLSGSDGFASGNWIFKKYVDNSGTSLTVTTYGGHALRVDKWLYQPFISAQVSNEKRVGVVTLLDETAIVETNQATALTAGSGVTWNEDTNPSSIISFTGGAGTLSVGNQVTGGTSGANGFVTKIVNGDSLAGTVHLKLRSVADFSGTEGLSNGSGWTATLTSGSQQDFSIWIDGLSKSMQTLHDYLAALTSETILTATGELIHEWGRDSQGRALNIGAAGFYTERSYAKGVFITNFGAGTIEKFTDDTGGTWTPPSSVTVEVIVLDDSTGLGIQYANVRLHKTSDKSVIMSKATDVNGEASIPYNYVSVLDIDGWVRQWDLIGSDYVQKNVSGQITISGFSQVVRLVPIN